LKPELLELGRVVTYTGSIQDYAGKAFRVTHVEPEFIGYDYSLARSTDGHRYTLQPIQKGLVSDSWSDYIRNVRRQSITVARKHPRDSDCPYVGIDLDDTLFKSVWRAGDREGFGKPILENFAKLDEVVAAGWTPVIYTARGWNAYDSIRAEMAKMRYPDIQVICGKPIFQKYIGDEAENEREDSWLP
jgi:isochorismate hydrolase